MSSEMFAISLSILCTIMHARIYYVVCYCTILLSCMYILLGNNVPLFWHLVCVAIYRKLNSRCMHMYVHVHVDVSVGSYLWCM